MSRNATYVKFALLMLLLVTLAMFLGRPWGPTEPAVRIVLVPSSIHRLEGDPHVSQRHVREVRAADAAARRARDVPRQRRPGARTEPACSRAGAPHALARCTLAVVTVVELGLYALLLAVAAVAVWRTAARRALPLRRRSRAPQRGHGRALRRRRARLDAHRDRRVEGDPARGRARARRAATRCATRRLPFRPWVGDWLALAFAVLAVVYAVIPQSALGGLADSHTVALALRHDIDPVAAYFLGRSLLLRREDLRRLAWTLLGVAGVRRCGRARSTSTRCRSDGGGRAASSTTSTCTSGYDYHGTGEHPYVAGLPENFIYNLGGDKPFLRRLVSTFLSPLASSYLFVVALLVTARRDAPKRCGDRSRRSSLPPACCGRSPARRSSRSPRASSCSQLYAGVRSGSWPRC